MNHDWLDHGLVIKQAAYLKITSAHHAMIGNFGPGCSLCVIQG